MFDERDLEEVIDNRYARFAAKASDHREVGEGVVGPAAGGCGDVDSIAALFDAEGDRFFEVGGIERGVASRGRPLPPTVLASATPFR